MSYRTTEQKGFRGAWSMSYSSGWNVTGEDALKGREDALKGGEDAGQRGDHQATFRQRNTRRSKAPERSEVRGVLLPQLDFSGPAVLFFWWILPLFAPFINIWSCRSCCHFPFLLSLVSVKPYFIVKPYSGVN